MAGAEGGDRGLSAKIKTFTGDQDAWDEWKAKFRAYLYCTDPNLVTILGTDRPPADQVDNRAQWDARAASIYSRLTIYTEGVPSGIVAGFDSGMNGVGAWTALSHKYDHRGTFGHAILHAKITSARIKGDPDKYFTDIDR